MPASYDYADRICARLPRVLQELREGRRLSRYALWQGCGVSREMIGRIEDGESIPTLHAAARLAHGLDRRLAELVAALALGSAEHVAHLRLENFLQ